MPQRPLSATPCCAAHKKTARAGGIFFAVRSRSSACRAVAREASEGWWSQAGSNRRPRECHLRALPSALWPQFAIFLAAFGKRVRRAKASGLLFLLDGLADDVGHIGIAFFLFLDEGGIVEALIDLDLFAFGSRCRAFCRRLLALLFGLGVFERDEFGIRGLRHDHLGLRHGRGARDRRRRRRLGPRARWRWNDDRYDLAGIGRNHRRLAEIVELAAGFRTDALGAEFSFRHGQVPQNGR